MACQVGGAAFSWCASLVAREARARHDRDSDSEQQWEPHKDADAVDASFDGGSSAASTCPSGSSGDLGASGRSSSGHDADDAPSSPVLAADASEQQPHRRLRGPRRPAARPRVPLISATSLYNRLQTSGLVVIDCRAPQDFAARHLPDALPCPRVSSRGAASVDEVLRAAPDAQLRAKLARRDLMEIVVVGGNRSGAALLYRLDWGFRFARMLLAEGRVFSVRFLAPGFSAFAKKYDFMLESDTQAAVDAPVDPTVAAGVDADVAETQAKWTHYPNEIVDDFLFLGSFWQANSAEVMGALRITHVVNLGALTARRHRFPGVSYLDVAVKDHVDADIAQEFAPALRFIRQAAAAHGRVLVHCVQGVSRSSTVVIWYMMRETGCTLSAAYSHVLKCRPLIFPNRGFLAQLLAHERQLYGQQSVDEDELELLQNGLLPPVDRSTSALRSTFL